MKPGEGMLPYLGTVLARQRRDYGIDEERFPSQYPVESQAANIDQTPEHNLAADRLQDQEDTQPSSSEQGPASGDTRRRRRRRGSWRSSGTGP